MNRKRYDCWFWQWIYLVVAVCRYESVSSLVMVDTRIDLVVSATVAGRLVISSNIGNLKKRNVDFNGISHIIEEQRSRCSTGKPKLCCLIKARSDANLFFWSIKALGIRRLSVRVVRNMYYLMSRDWMSDCEHLDACFLELYYRNSIKSACWDIENIDEILAK